MELELTVLIPTLDEAESLPTVLRHVRVVAAELTPNFEILVVDGGSSDGTPERAEAEGARVVRQTSRGFGAAVREGLAAAKGRWIICMDGDGSHPAAAFRALWERREKARLVIASRFVEGGSADMSFKRYWLSWWLNVVSRAVLNLPVRDASSGLRLYDGPFVRALPLSADDFTIQQEVLVRTLAAGGAVDEIPFHYAPRLGGASKASIPVLAGRYLRMLGRLRLVRGRAEPAAFLAVLALAVVTSAVGLRWGLPDERRHAPWGGPPSEAEARELTDRWNKLYRDIEQSHQAKTQHEAAPDDAMVASRRSYLLHTEHPDEKKSFIVLSRMRPWRLEFQPLYAQYGGGFIYPLGAALLAAPARLTTDMAHYLRHPEDMGGLYLVGRLLVAAAHVGTVVVLYLLARGLAGWGAGALAAALWALCPLAVWQAHLVKPHAWATFWVALAALTGSGLAMGVAAGSSLAAAPFVLLLRRPRAWLIAGLVFVALNPYLFFAYKDFAWELEVYSPQKVAATWAGLSELGSSVGWGLLAVVVAGLVAHRQWGALIAVAVLLARFGGLAVRLFHPAVALGCAYGAALVWRLPPAPRAVLAAALLAVGAARSLPALRDMARNDTRARAAAWIDANVPAGATVGLAYHPDPAHVPPFRFSRYKLVVDRSCPKAQWLVLDEGAFAVASCAPYELAAQFGEPGADPSRFAGVSFRIYKLKS